jgi:hypothetical protein
MKVLKVPAIFIAVLLVVIAFGIHVWLDRFIKQAVEIYGPKLTHGSVVVVDVETSLLTGTARIEGLVVGNPPGFAAPTALMIKKARVRVNPTTIFSETLVIQEVVIEAADVTFEGSLNRNNLTVLSENIRAANMAVGATATGTPTLVKADRGRKVILRDFRLTNAYVTVLFTGGKTMSFTLPEIHVRDLGAGSEGATARELVGATAQALQQAVTRNLTGVGQLVGTGGA